MDVLDYRDVASKDVIGLQGRYLVVWMWTSRDVTRSQGRDQQGCNPVYGCGWFVWTHPGQMDVARSYGRTWLQGCNQAWTRFSCAWTS